MIPCLGFCCRLGVALGFACPEIETVSGVGSPTASSQVDPKNIRLCVLLPTKKKTKQKSSTPPKKNKRHTHTPTVYFDCMPPKVWLGLEPLKKTSKKQTHSSRISKKRFTLRGSRRQPPRVHDQEKKIKNKRLSPTKLKRGARSRTLRVQPKAGFGNTPKGKPGRTACRGNPSPFFFLSPSLSFYPPSLRHRKSYFGNAEGVMDLRPLTPDCKPRGTYPIQGGAEY